MFGLFEKFKMKRLENRLLRITAESLSEHGIDRIHITRSKEKYERLQSLSKLDKGTFVIYQSDGVIQNMEELLKYIPEEHHPLFREYQRLAES